MKNIFNPFSGGLTPVLNKATEIKYTPSGDLVSINVQTALDEIESQILSIPTPLTYKGTWDASTNTPTLSNTDTGAEGFLYQVNVAGTVDFGAGPITFAVGDKVVNDGSQWQKWDLTDAVLEVNGQTGLVSLTTADIPENTNLYFTDERAQDAVGTILANTATINLTYADATPSISADVNDSSITDTKLVAGINANKIADGSVSNAEFQYLDGVTSSIQTQLNSKVSSVPGDILTTSFSAPISASPANVTGAVFSNAVVRSFDLTVDAVGASVYESFNIKGIQRGADWIISQDSFGDTSGIAFSVTTAGQIQYISNAALTLKFKADTVSL